MKATIQDGKQGIPLCNRGNEQSVSTPTFAAKVQAKLFNVNDKTQQVSIRRGTHLGKHAVYFSAENYFINLA